jgi:hypothetical protein
MASGFPISYCRAGSTPLTKFDQTDISQHLQLLGGGYAGVFDPASG